MQHLESNIVVYSTTDYARFRMINGNRQLNENKINKIIREIGSGNDMLRYYPLQVRENADRLDILDGQHRFYISKHLKRPVHYILVKENKSMPEIAKVNSNVEKWKPEDFVNCYIQHGNNNYQVLRDFIDKYGFSLSVTLRLLKTGAPGNEMAHPEVGEEFRAGTFTVEHLSAAEELGDLVHLFKDFGNYRSRPFVIAIYRIKKAGLVTIPDLFAAYKEKPEMLTQQANYKAYINTLEQIYNYRKSKRIYLI